MSIVIYGNGLLLHQYRLIRHVLLSMDYMLTMNAIIFFISCVHSRERHLYWSSLFVWYVTDFFLVFLDVSSI